MNVSRFDVESYTKRALTMLCEILIGGREAPPGCFELTDKEQAMLLRNAGFIALIMQGVTDGSLKFAIEGLQSNIETVLEAHAPAGERFGEHWILDRVREILPCEESFERLT